MDSDSKEIGGLIRNLREEKGVSLRALSRNTELSPASLSAIENGQGNPTLATFHKLLKGLGTDFAEFFASTAVEDEVSSFFPSMDMKSVRDAYRSATFLFPKRDVFRFQMVSETLMPFEEEVEWEVHDCDLGGVLVSGGPMRLEIEGEGEWTMRKNDGFYVKAGLEHRVINISNRPLRMITVFDPPQY